MTAFTPQFFDALIIAVILIGLALAGLRLYKDFTRPLPPENPFPRPVSGAPPSSPPSADNDTEPMKPVT